MGLIASVVQMSSGDNLEDNLNTASRLIAQAKAEGANLVLLPENFYFMGRSTERFKFIEHLGSGVLQAFLSEQAQKNGIVLVGGTIPLCPDVGLDLNSDLHSSERILSCCPVFAVDGSYIAHYNKIHLFDVVVPGGESHQESAIFMPGQEVVTAKTSITKLGLSICYDLRFPELFRQLAKLKAQILTVPAAFTHVSGQAHWHTLLKARAIENQCYVLAANQCGQHNHKFKTYGHSMIIDPWGKVIAEADDCTVGVCTVQIDLDYQAELRASFPVLEHRVL
ncbi:carbon-nitrogen hydrolase [Piscirickettsia salmonis]|uniref:(R)-stereoselective amidase n=1 Tax=Piscirickettsia salmonis TaxID=1238 RepID=A0A9Q6PVZ1_PISSA|nr:carbon-nitrogen hydrolase family protein [Piscirickettsia salmonis]ALA24112.1 carbon-nitrogen hydrolase family protein [Piscirickettsia salmonis]APS44513.1 carbon-nitrogen hydrolase [Piscirickettsia salmonis]APS47874.1 carbon-nitrogen hydrolase [Piscirickettsia salmonis]APS51831.1 carbon-nitrogen hydrolase [Piscirickettsia salmonis]APS55050.1 carbon-nitrogen hydrolase [Piscirickettsia salmonis]